MSLVRRVARSAAIAVIALSSNGCFLFCIFSPGGCDAKIEQQITVAPESDGGGHARLGSTCPGVPS
ncbi:MAG: hypothetical protein IPN16_19560 [Gemmatimonadetes bacterium]|nr:hypothetical protein [Gemmatimonadota bacterium]